MHQRIAQVTLVVKDYDEAIDFYTKLLGFRLIEDSPIGDGKRWVTVAPQGAKECSLLLAKAVNEAQLNYVGNQTGGRVSLFLFTDDCWRDYENFKTKGVEFERQPEEMPYGIVAVFKDLYDNLWDLLQPNEYNKGVLEY